MDEEMKKLGYNPRFIRILKNEEKKFFIDNHDIIDNIKKRVKEEFSKNDTHEIKGPSDGQVLKLILMGIDPMDGLEFLQVVNQIIKSEIRDNKISKIFSESIVYRFSQFKSLNL